MGIRRYSPPRATSIVAGLAVYSVVVGVIGYVIAVGIHGVPGAAIEHFRASQAESDVQRRVLATRVDALATRLEAVETRLVAVERPLAAIASALQRLPTETPPANPN